MHFFLSSCKHRNLKRFTLAVVLLSASLAETVEGQSGRKTRSPEPRIPPPPASTNHTDVPLSSKPLVPLSNRVNLLLGRQPTHRRLQSESAIFASFVNHLNQDPNISTNTMGDIKHADAVRRAKDETEGYVVLLSFSIDSFQNGTIILNSPDLQVEYEVLAPLTGKKLTKGKIYFQSIGGGRMRKSDWPGGTPIKITAEATGIEAADIVHDWLRLQEVKKR